MHLLAARAPKLDRALRAGPLPGSVHDLTAVDHRDRCRNLPGTQAGSEKRETSRCSYDFRMAVIVSAIRSNLSELTAEDYERKRDL